MRESFHVDYLVTGEDDTTKAFSLYGKSKDRVARGGFKLRKWMTNDKMLKGLTDAEENHETASGSVTSEEETYAKFTLDSEISKSRPKKSEIVAGLTNLSKRGCLATIAQLWDPMGLIAPCTIELRIDLQELWSAGYSWDEILHEEIHAKWIRNIQILNQLLTYEFDKKLKPDNAVDLPVIHGFCNGDKANRAIIFLTWKLTNSNYFCVPLMVKAFVAPLKKKSITRMELMECLALSRLYSTSKEALKCSESTGAKTMFWMDSQTVLACIKTPPKRFKLFVSVRVAEIQESLDTQAFKYITSDVNPADVLTRGIPPEERVDEEPSKEIKSNKKTTKCKEPTPCTVSSGESPKFRQPTDNPTLQHLMKTCSTFVKARKNLAYVLRFINNARKKETRPISPGELKKSEIQMFKWCKGTINMDTVDQKLTSKPDKQGLLCAYGRLKNIRTLPNEIQNPLILPKGQQMADLLTFTEIWLNEEDAAVRAELCPNDAPVKTKTVMSRPTVPRYREDIHNAKILHRKAEGKWRKTRSDTDLQIFKKRRNHVIYLLNEAKRKFFTSFVEENSSDQGRQFHASKRLLGKNDSLLFPDYEDKSLLVDDIGRSFGHKIVRIRDYIDTIAGKNVEVIPEDPVVDDARALSSFKPLSGNDILDLIRRSSK
ncbi:hypothetical protein AWC38_SpisGene13037 [Stylophora pistillata]|uniref:Uncharacterized protein n=1 Tax=Stylophora pistillata TaxID=50429 RepID=A0A2B4S0X2_STYPI|nr:hypothetical protein AWC38_SpisGene13037 [Stylophora pistillata]